MRSSLTNRQVAIGQLEDDRGDGRAVRRADVVAVPTAVGGLKAQQLLADFQIVVLPVFLVLILPGALVQALGHVKMSVEIVPLASLDAAGGEAVLYEPLYHFGLGVLSAAGGPVVDACRVEAGDCGGGFEAYRGGRGNRA